MSETKTVAEMAAEVKTAFDASLNVVKEIAEKALAEAKSGNALSESNKDKADEAIMKMNALNEQLAQVEQKMVARHNSTEADESIGEQFVKSDSFQALQKSSGLRGKASMEVKATLTSAVTDTAGAVGNAIARTRLPVILGLPQRRMTIVDLIASGQMEGNSLEYVKETGFTNNAAPVAESTRKPESDMKLTLMNTSAKVIAHYMKASRQVLEDIPQLQSIISQRLLYGLEFRKEAQILSGDGTGQNLLGIIPQATAYAPPITVAGATSIDQMRLAMLQAALAEYPATGHVMNPIDWAWIELLKDTQGRYIIGNPQGTLTPTLWGLPVVTTQAIAVDKFLTGAFQLGAQVFNRYASRVEIATENEDDFVKNLVTILAEERLALAVYRPEAFIFGDMGRVA